MNPVTSRTTTGEGALAGLRVIEIGQYVSAPVAGLLLADCGAQVLKIERPGGDPARRLGAFPVWNRGKESRVLDLSTDSGRAALAELVAGADVVIENLAPPARRRLGVGFADLYRINPALVHCSVPAFGHDDAHADQRAGNSLIHSLVGFQTATSYSDSMPEYGDDPHYAAAPVASVLAGVTAAGAIVAALDARAATGDGQGIEVPLYNCAVRVLGIRAAGIVGTERRPKYGVPLIGRYRCADGRFIQPHGTFGHFARILMEVAGHPEWTAEAEADLTQGTTPERHRQWHQRLERIFATRDSFDWEARINAAGGAGGVCRSFDEWQTTTHARQAGLVVEIAGAGGVREAQPGVAVTFSRTPHRPDTSAPALDAHQQGTPGPRPAAWLMPDASAAPPHRQHPLDGVRVLDLSIIVAGPTTGRILAELGADVVKIDDPHRARPETSWVIDTNSGKRSVLLDLKTEEGQRDFWSLVADTDVVVENYRDGALEAIGIGYRQIAERFPHVVYASLSCYGDGGPSTTWHGWEQVAEGVTGLQMSRGALRGGPPLSFPFPICDYATGGLMAFAITAALLERRQSGRGQRVTTSLAQAAQLFQSRDAYRHRDVDPDGAVNRFGESALWRLYRGADDWFFIEIADDRDWQALARMPDFAGLATEERFGTPERRRAHDQDLAEALARCFATRPREYWVSHLAARGLRVATRRLYPDILGELAIREAGIVIEQQAPSGETVTRMGVTDMRFTTLTKRLGEPLICLGEASSRVQPGVAEAPG